ncbi:hypothetical protein PVAG01_01718 [Phlyctema vagabunda]|uniref:Zn(2)-C6 fungal-type domain-containing protein n=1 Tax=Phlyctema vagabunda TaxID=108571 RepID=A0ABR4PXU9_9HELO
MPQHIITGRISTTRGRSGCLTCRSRGYRCDETKPICKACSRLGRACRYGPSQTAFREVVPGSQRGQTSPIEYQYQGTSTGALRNQSLLSNNDASRRRSSETACSDRWKMPTGGVVDGDVKDIGLQQVQQRKCGNLQHEQYSTISVTSKGLCSSKEIAQVPQYLSLLPDIQPLYRRLLSHWSTHLGPALSASSVSVSHTDSFSYFITPMAILSSCTSSHIQNRHSKYENRTGLGNNALFAALMAVAASHLAQHDRSLELVSLREQQRAVMFLKERIERGSLVVGDDEALAAILLLRIFEVCNYVFLLFVHFSFLLGWLWVLVMVESEFKVELELFSSICDCY